MSNYEFWDELSKIFNAVKAYQDKANEFNKAFIHPWIRLGNVFDKHDRTRAEIEAFQKAIEINPTDGRSWYELGNLYFHTEAYDQAVDAFQKAIEIEPEFGWPYSNLALTLATQGKHEEAIPLYQKSIELLDTDKDKAMAWNRLGNVYRKLNRYEDALDAFHKADELDAENSGFRDELDEKPDPQPLAEQPEVTIELSAIPSNPIQLLVKEEPAQTGQNDQAGVEQDLEPGMSNEGADSFDGLEMSNLEGLSDFQIADPTSVPVGPRGQTSEEKDKRVPAEPELLEPGLAEGVQADLAAPDPFMFETFTSALESVEPKSGPSRPKDTPPGQKSGIVPSAKDLKNRLDLTGAIQSGSKGETEKLENQKPAEEENATNSKLPQDAVDEVLNPASAQAGIQTDENAEDESIRLEFAPNDFVPGHAAYEEYLKDNHETLDMLSVSPEQVEAETPDKPELQQPNSKIDTAGEFQIEMDTKNAHVWNELGNVYFNNSAYDDAIVAYSKAIELDRWFAWPYSNLALAYVQKGRLAEAILLYQRSIELFTSEKDKAVSWNRLGNVFRRLNDYDHAIAAYQRADELDPENTTLSLQSRFSLLGNYTMEQKPAYAS